MGTGKTFFAKKLYMYLKNYNFLDTDKLITYIYNRTIFIFLKKIRKFRKLEKNLINLIKNFMFFIFSLGGGTILKKINVLRTNLYSISICLFLNKFYIYNMNLTNRPLIKKRKNIIKMFYKRKHFYNVCSLYYIKNYLYNFKKTILDIFLI
ncbi:shikimate kinase [Candidatus Vidania fulgoroideorum]